MDALAERMEPADMTDGVEALEATGVTLSALGERLSGFEQALANVARTADETKHVAAGVDVQIAEHARRVALVEHLSLAASQAVTVLSTAPIEPTVRPQDRPVQTVGHTAEIKVGL